MKIRLATKKDADRLGLIHSLAYHKAYKNILPNDFLAKKTPENMSGNLLKFIDNGEEIYTIEYEEDIQGFISLNPDRENETEAEIVSLYINPIYWGKGLGNELIKNSINLLKKRGYNIINLWVLEENKRAIIFYEKNNFSRIKSKKITVLGTDVLEIKFSIKI